MKLQRAVLVLVGMMFLLAGKASAQQVKTENTYKVGTLILDLFDTKTKKLLWRGTSSDTLSNNSNKNIKNLDKGAEKMFKHFPPGPSKG